MFIKLSRYARVYISQTQINFIEKYRKQFPILETQLDIDDLQTARVLASKGALVRKKLSDNTQYALNRSMRIVDDKKDT
jgi:hypothetical protein